MLLFSYPAAAGEAYDRLFRLYDVPQTLSRERVPVCAHHGCQRVSMIRLDAPAWQRIAANFAPVAADPSTERLQIKRAIAEFELISGELAGTAGDRGGDLAAFGTWQAQQDCIDESTNTTVYLTLLEQAGLLRWHRVLPTAHRGFLLFGGWPHYTAVIGEFDNGQRWVVDSWFHDNGQAPEIIDLDTWKSGWKPDGFSF